MIFNSKVGQELQACTCAEVEHKVTKEAKMCLKLDELCIGT